MSIRKTPTVQPGSALAADPLQLLRILEADCGAEGFTIDRQRGHVVALRFREGVAQTIKRYPIDEVPDVS